MVLPNIDQGYSPKPNNPSNVAPVRLVNQNIDKKSKFKSNAFNDIGKLNQTIEMLNDCDDPTNANVIEKILIFEIVYSKPMHETPTNVDPNFACENVIKDDSVNNSKDNDVEVSHDFGIDVNDMGGVIEKDDGVEVCQDVSIDVNDMNGFIKK